MSVNDAHCHFFSPRFFETLGRETGRYGTDAATAVPAALGWDPPGSPDALTTRWLAELDRHGVGRAALIASVPGDESSVGAAVAARPGRFVGFFMVNPLAEDAIDRVRHGLGELGMRGVCLFPALQRYSLLDARVLAVVELVASHPGCLLFVHCGVLSVSARRKLGLPSRFELRFGQPADVQALAITWPGLPMVMPHFGGGFFREALMAADMCANVHLDTSSSNRWMDFHPGLTLSDVFRQALAVAGPERLLFGTDSSFFPRGWQRPLYELQMTAIEGLGLAAADQELIRSANFDRLFPPPGARTRPQASTPQSAP